jgi:hypothetical protein
MPGWATVRDRDGNMYYVDRDFRIHVTGEPDTVYKPVALENLQFSSEQSGELIKNHHPAEGLRTLKAIRTLSSLDARASGAGLKASKDINAMMRREKDRFVRYDHESALYIVRLGPKHIVYNDWMRWEFSHEGAVTILSRKSLEKEGYARDGSAFGIRFDSSAEKTFDVILTVNCDELNHRLRSADSFEELSRNRNPDDSFKRTVVRRADDSVLYRFEGGGPAVYAGFELFVIRGNKGYHVRTVTPAERSAAVSDRVMKLIENFSVKGSD